MNSVIKTCPRCKTQLKQGDGAFVLARKGTAGSEHSPGLPVTVYFCPVCGYMELYDLRVTARL